MRKDRDRSNQTSGAAGFDKLKPKSRFATDTERGSAKTNAKRGFDKPKPKFNDKGEQDQRPARSSFSKFSSGAGQPRVISRKEMSANTSYQTRPQPAVKAAKPVLGSRAGSEVEVHERDDSSAVVENSKKSSPWGQIKNRAEDSVKPVHVRSDEPPRPVAKILQTDPEAIAPVKTLRDNEIRIYGRHAVLAVVAQRIQAIRKVYYHRSAQNQLADLLRWCAQQHIGYREVEIEDLQKLSGSEHHEGVVLEIIKCDQPSVGELLSALQQQEQSVLLLLDGVGNPHNIGAILRIAAHFDVDGILLNPGNFTALNGAAYRVAEGGAEAQPYVFIKSDAELQAIKAAGYQVIAAQMHQAKPLWGTKLPKRALLVFGAEGSGVSDYMQRNADLLVQIPGSGKVESLNVAQSAAVLLAEYSRQMLGLKAKK